METRFADLQMTSMVAELGINGVYKYLLDRGIDKDDIEDCGLTIGMAHDLGLTNDDRMCVVFPHFDAQGSPVDWWSARLIEVSPAVPKGFAGLVPVKRGKMFCPAKEPPTAYLPPTLDWSRIQEGQVIYIHESCIKAINGAKAGYYSIGLNGVWGWGSKKHEITLLSAIKDLPWKAKKLKCVVVFDSNASSNDDVALAIRKFAERMRLICGVDAKHALLPKSPQDKDWGFDDFCVEYGYEHAAAWLENEDNWLDISFSELETLRLQLNQEVVVVRSIKRIVEQETGTVMNKAEFTDINFGHYTAWDVKGDKEVLVNVPKSWLAWDRRRQVERVEYSPGMPRLQGTEYLNIWRGMGVEPKEGDVSPWLRVLEYAVPNEKLRHWVTQWFAYPLQNLGATMNQFIHMYGPSGGGKNALLVPIIGIYGENAVSLGKDRIESDFNEVYATKQFINLDELHGGNDASALSVTNKIKMLTTSPKLVVNGKGKGEYSVANHVNLVTTSNYADGIKLDDGDRRCLVLRVGEKKTVIKDPAYWEAYHAWAESEDGVAALYHYLLNYDLTGFYPKGWAPETEEKEYVTDVGRSPMEKWVMDLAEDPSLVLPAVLRGAKVLSAAQLAFAYVSEDPMGRVTPALKNKLGQRLREAGFGNILVKVEGTPLRLWVLDEALLQAAPKEVAKEYLKYKPKV